MMWFFQYVFLCRYVYYFLAKKNRITCSRRVVKKELSVKSKNVYFRECIFPFPISFLISIYIGKPPVLKITNNTFVYIFPNYFFLYICMHEYTYFGYNNGLSRSFRIQTFLMKKCVFYSRCRYI